MLYYYLNLIILIFIMYYFSFSYNFIVIYFKLKKKFQLFNFGDFLCCYQNSFWGLRGCSVFVGGLFLFQFLCCLLFWGFVCWGWGEIYFFQIVLQCCFIFWLFYVSQSICYLNCWINFIIVFRFCLFCIFSVQIIEKCKEIFVNILFYWVVIKLS